MEKPAFTRVNLSDIRVIMVIMHVLMEELLCQVVMGQIPVLKCQLSSACGHPWLHLVMPCIKCLCFPRTELQGHLPSTREPRSMAARGSGVCRAEVWGLGRLS
jgi:hypothetical protein